MCRYAFHNYKAHYACFKCQKTFKRKNKSDIEHELKTKIEGKIAKCPQCNSIMADMGLDFKSPPKKDDKSWNQIENLFEAGITFHSCGCSGPGLVQKNKNELLSYLEEKKNFYIKHLRSSINSKTLSISEKNNSIDYWKYNLTKIETSIKNLS